MRVLLGISLIGLPAAGQQPSGVKRDTGSVAPVFAAGLGAYANNSGTGTWMQVTPDVVWTTCRVSITGSLPVYYLNAASSVDGLRAVWGIGDALLGTTLDFSGDSGTAYFTATGGFATGDEARGFGAGKFTWDLTGVLGMQIGRLGPYVNGGVSNSANVVGEAQSAGIGTGKLVPGQGGGNLIHLESGLELDLGHSVSLTGSAYGVFASVVSSTGATPATPLPRRGPRGRLLPPAARTQAVDDASDASDRGINVSVAALGRRNGTHQ